MIYGDVVERAQQWLESVRCRSRDAKALRSLGLLCCQRIRARRPLCRTGSRRPVQLPALRKFVSMDRVAIAALCRSVSLASSRARNLEKRKRQPWSEAFGAVALSYARAGDPSTTAALLRAGAQLHLSHPWLDEAEQFLLDQQTPEGSFGLFARETAILGGQDYSVVHLSLSVEILWAIAEVSAARSP